MSSLFRPRIKAAGTTSKVAIIDGRLRTSIRSVNRRRLFLFALASVAAVIVMLFLGRRTPRPSRTAPVATAPRAPLRPHSFWTVPAAEDAAAPAAIPAPSPPAKPDEPTLSVLVEDATGGPIARAAIAVEDKPQGLTDAAGWLRLPAQAVPRMGSLDVTAPGYARGHITYSSPGEVRMQLLPGSQIAGVVVESGSDRPVADVPVFAAGATATSDQAGRFVLRDLPAGLVRLEARGPHHFGALRDPIPLGLGKVVNDVRLEVRPAFTVHGKVLAGGEPLHGMAMVEGCGGGAPVGADGRYEITGVAPGRCALSLNGRGSSEFLTLGKTFPIEVKDADVTQDIDAGERHGLTVALADRRGRPIVDRSVEATQSGEQLLVSNRCSTGQDGRCSLFGFHPGTVELNPENSDQPKRKVTIPAADDVVRFVLDEAGSIAGRLTSPDGRPPFARGIVAQGRKGGRDLTRSAPDGTFTLANLPADHYEIEVRDEAFAWDKRQPAEARAQVSLGAGEQRSDIVIQIGPEDAHVAGQVLDASDRPVPDALVTLDVFHSMMVGEGAHIGGRSMKVTGADGSFSFDHLSPAYHYDLVAHDPEGRRARLRDQTVGSPVILHLIELARLEVRIDDDASPSPLSFVQVLDGDKVLEMRLLTGDGDGIHFDALTPGRRNVRATSGASAVVDLVAGQLTTVTLKKH
jgi:hypothetical protein